MEMIVSMRSNADIHTKFSFRFQYFCATSDDAIQMFSRKLLDNDI